MFTRPGQTQSGERFGLRGDAFFLTAFCNTLSSSHTQLEVASRVERSVSRQGRIWVHADSQVEEQFLHVRQYSRSLHDFHGTFHTRFHHSTSRKVRDRSQNSRFHRESCHRRFATMSATAGNSHYSPVIGGIKQPRISGPV